MAGPVPSPRKPRKKAKKTADTAPDPKATKKAKSSSSHNNSHNNSSHNNSRGQGRPRASEGLARAPAFPLASFLWPARGAVSQWEVLPLILLFAGLFRWAAGLWGYSGFRSPPMFGDYEAQRHWMELTTQLPVSQWYFHDLQWWGLDYPPLTAYHSWLLGRAGALIDPAWFALRASRGLEDPRLKVFMRATVVVSEYLTYVPAAVVFVRRFSRLSGVASWTASVALAAILLQPATILVDHVHFQYNTVMLGLVTASLSSMLAGRHLWAAVFFVGALGFKQMALYYALPVFAFLLGSCLSPRLRFGRLLALAAVTLAAFAALLLPILAGTLLDVHLGIAAHPDEPRRPLPLWPPHLAHLLDPAAAWYPVLEQLLQIVHRVFPLARGLFEDKVANFWCAANVLVKLKDVYTPPQLQAASLALTLLAIAPPSLLLLARPQRLLLPYALAASAWGFFLFSYQVHEKSVLLPLLPTTLLLAGPGGLGRPTRAWVGFANLLGVWTLYPLLARVDLAVPYAVLALLWAFLLGLPPTSLAAYFPGDGQPAQWGAACFHLPFYLAMLVWHVLERNLTPPPDKPDLWVVANVGIGAAGFALCYLWSCWRLLADSGLLPRAKTAKKNQ